jgi:energy-coupling factor transporter ATP-binding protein EcfA2
MTEQQARINGLIERLEKHQAALKLNDVQFVARYRRHLRSTKSWRDRLCARAWGELGRAINKWEGRLTAFCAELDGGTEIAEFYKDLPITQYCAASYQLLQGQSNDRRCAFVIGPTGVGKSYAMRHLHLANLERSAYLCAHKGMCESMPRIAIALARAVGSEEKTGGAATFDAVVEHLKSTPLTMLIEDAHEGGVLMLKLIKTIIDSSRSRVMVGTYPTAWNKLVNSGTDAMAEARQLIGRSIKPINTTWIKGSTEEDVVAYVIAACGKVPEIRSLAERLLPSLRKYGNLRLLADGIELASANAEEQDLTLDAELIEEAVLKLCPKDPNKNDDR